MLAWERVVLQAGFLDSLSKTLLFETCLRHQDALVSICHCSDSDLLDVLKRKSAENVAARKKLDLDVRRFA